MLEELGLSIARLFYCVLFWFQLTFKFDRPSALSVVELSADPSEEDFELEKLDGDQELIFQGTSGNSSVFCEVHVHQSSVSAVLLFLLEDQKYQLPDGPLKSSSRRSTKRVLELGPLKIELREPFRRWRLTFRGDLRAPDGSLCFVHWQSWWTPVSDPYFYTHDVPVDLAAKFAAISNPRLFSTLRSLNDNLQWGSFRGRLLVEGTEPKVLNLRGFRLRKTSKSNPIRLENVTTTFLSTGERTVRLELSIPNCSRILEFGRRFCANRQEERLNRIGNDEVEHLAVHSFKCGNRSSVNLEISRLLGRQGCGFTRFVEGDSILAQIDSTRNLEFNYVADEFERNLHLLPLTHRACMDPEMAGGKGANLAKLKTVEQEFTVPGGFVVTTVAFQIHLSAHSQLQTFVSSLDLRNGHDFQDVETRARRLFSSTQLCKELQNSIFVQLSRMYEGKELTREFAVRSSAVGEDGAELSSAGQLESFLHVKVEAPLAPPMGVVVQEMISNGTSGVIFTNDPVRFDPSRVIMNLVEGDGEVLVSGQTIPTQLTISRRDMSVSEKVGRDLLSVDCCLHVARVALYLERVFEQPQDVEFVCKNNQVFVVQSRNITGLDAESDWELEHEFDTIPLSGYAVISTANVGEVMPVPLTPLGCSTIGVAFDRTIKSIFSYMTFWTDRLDRHSNSVIMIYRQRVFFELLESLLRNWEDVAKNRGTEYNLAGGKILTDEMIDFGRLHFPPKTPFQRAYEGYAVFKMIFVDSKRILEQIERTAAEMNLFSVPEDADGILKATQVQLNYFIRLIEHHSKATFFSSVTYALTAMTLLGGSDGDLDLKTLNNIAIIYSNNPRKLISAEIPKIARAIKSQPSVRLKLDESKDFASTVEFLKTHDSESGQLTREFLRDHGHRGLHELLLSGRPWGQDHEQLVGTIKRLVDDPNIEKDEPREIVTDLNKLLDCLDVQLSRSQRFVLKILIPHAHRAVQLREAAKNLIVYGTFLVRNSFIKLGERLHQEKRLNRPDVVFQLTHLELKELVCKKNTYMLSRARRRRRIYGTQFEQRYAGVTVGYPPSVIEQRSEQNGKTDLCLTGTTVCEGRVCGRARVARNLHDAADTRRGEILITTWTDIAWSPLFPVVAGLVTEIGGLLSHGAVVAREYRLPCMIAVHDATTHFKTGDMVLLNTFKGTIERVNEETEN